MKQLQKNLLCSSILFLFTCAKPCLAQVNLVQDGSFEDTVANWATLVLNAKVTTSWEWFLGASPSSTLGATGLFSNIHPDPTFSIPNGAFSIGFPHGGHNAIQMITHADLDKVDTSFGWNYTNMRTPIRAKLRQKLISGRAYCGTVWLVADARQTYYNTNGMGMYFDNGQLDTVITKLHDSSGMYGRYCKAQVIENNVISDIANWTKIQGSFIANGTEEYVTIGNWLTDTTQIKVLNGPAAWQCGDCFGSSYMIDDASVIPIDISSWLRDTSCAIGDSVWVGLHHLDYGDGKWYDANMQFIKKGQGFWYTPTQGATTFIQEIDVCGTLKYDTLKVYAWPASINNQSSSMQKIRIAPNPVYNELHIASEDVLEGTIEIYNLLGDKVLQQKISQPNKTHSVRLGNLQKGVYFVRISERYIRFEKW
jgi:Secretion system C-terminal sorting domain